MTMVGMALVDRKGRRFLLILGTSGIIVSLIGVGILFLKTERLSLDSRNLVQAMVGPNQELTLRFDRDQSKRLLTAKGFASQQIEDDRASLAIIYSYGDFTAATSYVRSDDPAAAPIHITRASCVPANKIEALFKNPFANLMAAQSAPLNIEKALIGPIPDARHRWRVALCLYTIHGVLCAWPRRVCGLPCQS
jgi:SP family myo-inositol transporter-like MFS transporter 13